MTPRHTTPHHTTTLIAHPLQGERAIVYMQAEYAFGSTGHFGFSIPPNTNILYEIELVKVQQARTLEV